MMAYMSVIAPHDDSPRTTPDVDAFEELSTPGQPPPPTAKAMEPFKAPDFFERVVTASVVALCSAFVFWQMQPDLIFSDTTPTGGDLGAHVWGPAFLRDELLPNFQLSGWTPDW